MSSTSRCAQLRKTGRQLLRSAPLHCRLSWACIQQGQQLPLHLSTTIKEGSLSKHTITGFAPRHAVRRLLGCARTGFHRAIAAALTQRGAAVLCSFLQVLMPGCLLLFDSAKATYPRQLLPLDLTQYAPR